MLLFSFLQIIIIVHVEQQLGQETNERMGKEADISAFFFFFYY